ncbi:hypothetical protein AADG42_06435 [Ammonicoccus fulvus]|uniref:Integral membrane protein n=1 Tax=Ammonicoccus fulvus TaxID=3138240 RepID=A0ABZ3FLP2_9ACTN
MSSVSRPATLARSGGRLIRRVVVDPIRDEGPAPGGWPAALRPAWILLVPPTVLAMALVLLAGPLRSNAHLTGSSEGVWLPTSMIAPMLVLVVACLAALAAAVLHLHWAASTLGMLLLLPALLGPFAQGGLPTIATVLGAWVALLVFLIVRRRRAPVWWEFVVCVGILAVAVCVPAWLNQRSTGALLDTRAIGLESALVAIAWLTIPAVFVGGYGLAAFTVRLGRWGSHTVAGRSVRGLLALVAVAGVWVVVQTVVLVRRGDEPWRGMSIAVSAGLLVVTIAIAAGLVLVSRRRNSLGDLLHPDRLGQELEPVIWPVAFATAGIFLVLGVVSVAEILITGSRGEARVVSPAVFVQVAQGVLAVVVTIWAVRRARAGKVLMLFPAAALLANQVIRVVTRLGDIGATWWSPATVVAASVLGLVLWLVRGNLLDRNRLLAVLTLLLLAALWPWRFIIAEPFVLFATVSAAVTVLFGLVWALLTDVRWVQGDSRSFPRGARVLLWWGYGLLSLTVLAWLSLTAGQSRALNLENFAGAGDDVLGTMLVVGVAVACLTALWRRPRNGHDLGSIMTQATQSIR